jgi:hypothetical protein
VPTGDVHRLIEVSLVADSTEAADGGDAPVFGSLFWRHCEKQLVSSLAACMRESTKTVTKLPPAHDSMFNSTISHVTITSERGEGGRGAAGDALEAADRNWPGTVRRAASYLNPSA